MRHTSLEAYNTLHTNGFLTGLQAKVYDVLYNNGPLTQGEAWNEFLPDYQRHSVDPRFAELRKMGVIQTVGDRPCRFSGVKGLEWDVTGHIPTEKPAHVPKRKFEDEVVPVVELLNRIDVFLKTLPEGGMTEVLQYDISVLKGKLNG